MELLRADIKKKLPKLKDDEMEKLMVKLDTLGLRDLDDAHDNKLQVEDLDNCIPLIMARKLISMWSAEADHDDGLNVVAPASTHQSRYIMPEIDFKEFDPEIKDLLEKKTITRAERGKVMHATAKMVLAKSSSGRNLAMESWIHVAFQLAAKNKKFLDSPFATEDPEKTVFYSSSILSTYAGFKCNSKRANADDSTGALGQKRKKPSAVQRDEYGLTAVDFAVEEHSSQKMLDCATELQNLHKKNIYEWQLIPVAEKMQEIWLHIRYKLLVEKMSCKNAKTMFPFLFEGTHLLDFFKELTGIDADLALGKFVESRLEHTYNHFTRFGSRRDQDDFFMIDRKMIAAYKKQQTMQPKLIAALLMAFMHLHDVEVDLDTFIEQREVTMVLISFLGLFTKQIEIEIYHY